jgi:choline kinase
MKGIILAAGKGTRLNGGVNRPKCLVEIGGITLLHRQILALRASGVSEIVVVVGFEADRVRRESGEGICFVENPQFAETSSLYSLWLARDHLADGFVVLNSDVLFHPQVLDDFLKSAPDDALLIAYSDHTTSPLGDEEMKVKVRDGMVVDITKEMDPLEADGENVGIVKFGAKGAQRVVCLLDDLIGKGFQREWAPRAFLEFASHSPLHAISTKGYPWIEIDFPEDYKRAKEEIYPRILALS